MRAPWIAQEDELVVLLAGRAAGGEDSPPREVVVDTAYDLDPDDVAVERLQPIDVAAAESYVSDPDTRS
jgi:hypothetical protein